MVGLGLIMCGSLVGLRWVCGVSCCLCIVDCWCAMCGAWVDGVCVCVLLIFGGWVVDLGWVSC